MAHSKLSTDIHISSLTIASNKAVKLAMGLLSLSAVSLMTTGCWQVTTVTSDSEEQTEPAVQKTVTNAEQTAINNASTESQPVNNHQNHDGKVNTTNKAEKPTTKSEQSSMVNDTIAENAMVERKAVQTSHVGVREGGEPIQYNLQSWSKKEVTPLTIEQVSRLPEEIAQVMSIDENSLDYASHPAIKYRFMKSNAPYFDLVDSNDYLEIDWYYANPHDSDDEKNSSINHAKKAHKFARQIMGSDGGRVVADMLGGNPLTSTKVNGTEVTLAKCEFYSCMLILKKPKETAEASTTTSTEASNTTDGKKSDAPSDKKTQDKK